MKGVQCYELFGGIALKNHTFSFFSFRHATINVHKFEKSKLNTEEGKKQSKKLLKQLSLYHISLYIIYIYIISLKKWQEYFYKISKSCYNS